MTTPDNPQPFCQSFPRICPQLAHVNHPSEYIHRAPVAITPQDLPPALLPDMKSPVNEGQRLAQHQPCCLLLISWLTSWSRMIMQFHLRTKP